jgi:peptide chain release factor 2
MIIRRCDCTRQTFRCGGKGGQNVNKVETGVRYVHEPSGLRGEARDTRFQAANDRLAWSRLVLAAQRLVEESRRKREAERYAQKPEASFGSQDRTYRMVGSGQGVTDHRTGAHVPDVLGVLDGEIDWFVRQALLRRI